MPAVMHEMPASAAAVRAPALRTDAAAGRARQRGAVTLFSAVIILVLMSMVAFFANRNILFERKTSANQYRSSKAIEAADAGVEWAMANLNTLRKITAACALSAVGTDRSFRDRYLDGNNNGLYDDVSATDPALFTDSTPLCTRIGGNWSCSCPTAAAPTAATCTEAEGCPTFRLGFERVIVDPAKAAPLDADQNQVRVISTGCTNAQRPCVPTASAAADGTATARQVLKLMNGLATIPASAITAKGNVDFGSNAITATNLDPGTNGVTINAGGTITGFINDSTIHTLPGTPPTASLIPSDTSLSSMSDDQMFMSYFGVTKDAFRNSTATKTITCSGVCNSELANAINEGARQIWVEGDITLNQNATYGSETAPIMLVVNGNIELRGTMIIYGLVYCQDSTWDNTGGGDATVIGAVISEGNFTATGTPNPTYDPDVLRRLRDTTGAYAKVPGGWRDFR